MITVLALIAIMGMLVLTVDVGGLLLKRRAMVNASDAAALAAAQSCADTGDSFAPESRADIYASANVDGLLAENGGITEIVGCDTGRGHVTVEYSHPQSLFFAGIFGFGDHGSVTHGGDRRVGTRRRGVRRADRAGLRLPPGRLQDPRRDRDR